jgi:hypothetical protein
MSCAVQIHTDGIYFCGCLGMRWLRHVCELLSVVEQLTVKRDFGLRSVDCAYASRNRQVFLPRGGVHAEPRNGIILLPRVGPSHGIRKAIRSLQSLPSRLSLPHLRSTKQDHQQQQQP